MSYLAHKFGLQSEQIDKRPIIFIIPTKGTRSWDPGRGNIGMLGTRYPGADDY